MATISEAKSETINAMPSGASNLPSIPDKKEQWNKSNDDYKCCIDDRSPDFDRSIKNYFQFILSFSFWFCCIFL